MTGDPIIDEVRRARDEIARRHGYDIAAIFEAFRELEAMSGKDHVSLPARRVLDPRSELPPHAAVAADGASEPE